MSVLSSVLVSGLVLTTSTTLADTFKGSLALESINYLELGSFADQYETDVRLRLSGDAKGRKSFSSSGDLEGRYELRFSVDDESFIDPKVAALYWSKDTFQIRAGVLQERWGLMSTFSPVDIFNQVDSVENIDGSERLGQPGIALDLTGQLLDASVVFSPGGRERRLAEGEQRYRLAPFDYEESEFEGEQENLETAARLGWQGDLVSINLMHFVGHSREPEFTPVLNEGQLVGLTPFYRRIEQSGVTIEAALGDYVLRGEAFQRRAENDEEDEGFTGYAAGVERLFYGDNGSDFLVFAEYFSDERTDDDPVTLFNNDLSLGVQLIVNDQVGDIALQVIYDLDSKAQLWSLDYQQSISDNIRFEAKLRVPNDTDEDAALSSFENDSELRLGLRWAL